MCVVCADNTQALVLRQRRRACIWITSAEIFKEPCTVASGNKGRLVSERPNPFFCSPAFRVAVSTASSRLSCRVSKIKGDLLSYRSRYCESFVCVITLKQSSVISEWMKLQITDVQRNVMFM